MVMEYIYTMHSGGEYTSHHIEFTTLIGEYSIKYHFMTTSAIKVSAQTNRKCMDSS